MSNATGHGSDLAKEAMTANRSGQVLVYFAAERTLMAWIRAALAFMALGFVIDRFGLVVHEMAHQSVKAVQSSALSFLADAGLVIVGVLMAVVAAMRYAHFAWRYRQTGDTDPGYGLGPAVFFTAVVALAGAIIVGYLIAVAP